MLKNESNIINFRRKEQPNADERIDLKERAYNIIGYGFQSKLGRIFRTSAANVNEAFKGNNPSLMNRLKKYILQREERIGAAA